MQDLDDLPFSNDEPAAQPVYGPHMTEAQEEEAYWALEARAAAYDPDLAYERHLESRFDPDAMADLAWHDSLWPNGYGYCPNGACRRGVYHPGECIEDDGAAAEADRVATSRRLLSQEYIQESNRRGD